VHLATVVLIAALLGVALVIAIALVTKPFLAASRTIDAINLAIGRTVLWLVLIVVLLSSTNAIVRKIFDRSSNGLLEAQWYLFSAIFLLCAAYTLMRNEHVRIDVISGRFSRRTLAGIDIFGLVFFLLPMAGILLVLSWPVFLNSVATPPPGATEPSLSKVWHGLFHPSTWADWSADPGGLMRWPVKLLLPVGFLMLALQGFSELVKRIAFLKGMVPDPNEKLAAHGVD
jgi:TRAP-type mannitol/chloroaromatic compound transport system permease small subunit